jgi:hypothetical protein
MKGLLLIISALCILTSCATTNETKSSASELRNEKKLAKQAIVKNAVESKKFIIKFDRLYFSHGGMAELRPKNNYIIVDGNKAIISTAYLGRQYDIRPIEGINMRGETLNYVLESDSAKGKFELKMKVTNGNNSFDVYITIGKNGSCTASLTNARIDMVRYSGEIVPIKVNKVTTPINNIII